jgi:oligopeptide/dipeptide ABC transporter ATP-binding protein
MYRGELMEEAAAADLYRTGIHPYTELLFSSAAGLGPGPGARREPAGKAEAPAENGAGRGEGCSFAGRCPLAAEQCRAGRPPLRERERGHWVRCFQR